MLAQGSSGGGPQRDHAPSSPSPEYNQQSGGRPPGGPENSRMGPPSKKVYSNLDLIKADTPVTTARISRMLHQLEFKLQVETQYKKGIDKMVKLYQAEGDKKSRADAEAKRVESEKKIQLLQASLKRYKNLFIMESEAEEPEPAPGTYPPKYSIYISCAPSDHLFHVFRFVRGERRGKRSLEIVDWYPPYIHSKCSRARPSPNHIEVTFCFQGGYRHLRIHQGRRHPTHPIS